jgi:hypothetical protein
MLTVCVSNISEPPPATDVGTPICWKCRGTQRDMTDRIWRRLFGEAAPEGEELLLPVPGTAN